MSTVRRYLIALVVLGGLAMPASAAAAAVQTFHRFEAVATANYPVTEQCADGSTADTRAR